MKFISASEIAKSKSVRNGGKVKTFAGITVSLVYYHDRPTPSRIITIRLDEKSMHKARINIDDRVDVLFSEDSLTWLIKLATNNNEARYKISKASNKTNSGILRFTWYEGMPWFDDLEKTKKIKIKVRDEDEDLKIDIGKIQFSIKEPLDVEYIFESNNN